MVVTQIEVSQWIRLLPPLAKAHRLWTDLTMQCLGAGLGLPWHELILTCLKNGLMDKWPLSHSLEVKFCECLLWSSVTNQRSHGTANHCSFCLLRLALEQPSNLSWEPVSRKQAVVRKHIETTLHWDLQTREEGGTSLREHWPTSPCRALRLLTTCRVLVPCPTSAGLRSWRTAGRGSVTWEKRGRY